MTVKVLSIDDTPPNQALINKVLSPYFDLDLAMNAEEGWCKLQEFSPDVILLDVNMPGQNGYDFCRVLREDTEKDNVGVIFVSALTSLDERLEGYAAGGDDYVCKPFDPAELKAKISANSVVRQKLVAAKTFAAQAQNAAFTAMTSTSEMGRVLDFLVNSLQTSDYQDVAGHLLTMLKSFGLSGAISFRSEEIGNQYYSPSGVISPLEQALFEQVEGADRIVAHKHLYMFNSPHSSILVKNMPSDEDVLGRLRDHLAIAVTVVEEKVKTLDVLHQAERNKRALLTSGIGLIDNTITKMDSRFSAFVDTMKSRLDNVMTDMEAHLMLIDLSPEQETSLLDKIKEQSLRLDDLYEETDDFERELIEASTTLRKVLD